MDDVRPEAREDPPQLSERRGIGSLQPPPKGRLAAEARVVRRVIVTYGLGRAGEKTSVVASGPKSISEKQGDALCTSRRNAVVVDDQDSHRGAGR